MKLVWKFNISAFKLLKMNSWNIERIGDELFSKAEGFKRYLKELKVRIRKKDPRADSCKLMFDQTLAKYTLYNHLYNRSCFETKEALKVELESLKVNSILPAEKAYSEEVYLSEFRNECQSYLNKDES